MLSWNSHHKRLEVGILTRFQPYDPQGPVGLHLHILHDVLNLRGVVSWMVASDDSNLHCIWARLDFNDVISFSSLVTSTWSKVTGGNLCSSFATNVGTSSGSVAFIKVMMSWTLLSVPSLLLDGIWSSFPVVWKSSILPLLISSSLKFDLQICMMLTSSMVSIAFCMNANSSNKHNKLRYRRIIKQAIVTLIPARTVSTSVTIIDGGDRT
ncbi:hypothetical protein SFRURICE_001090 [Spodoptera frugiperda]|nr:hypothetical protein SFRURICE_001090 [Spodoptera frugiperda]